MPASPFLAAIAPTSKWIQGAAMLSGVRHAMQTGLALSRSMSCLNHSSPFETSSSDIQGSTLGMTVGSQPRSVFAISPLVAPDQLKKASISRTPPVVVLQREPSRNYVGTGTNLIAHLG